MIFGDIIILDIQIDLILTWGFIVIYLVAGSIIHIIMMLMFFVIVMLFKIID